MRRDAVDRQHDAGADQGGEAEQPPQVGGPQLEHLGTDQAPHRIAAFPWVRSRNTSSRSGCSAFRWCTATPAARAVSPTVVAVAPETSSIPAPSTATAAPKPCSAAVSFYGS